MTILKQATDQQLADSVEENLYDLFRSMAAVLPGGVVEETEKFSRHSTFPLNPMFNGVWNTCLTPDEVNTAIEENLAWYKARKTPYVFWWFTTKTHTDGIQKALEAHRFDGNMIGDPGMVVDLDQLNDDIKTPNSFSIARVSDQKMLEQWRDVFCASFEVPIFAGQSWVDATLSAGIDHAPWQLYLGYLDDQPVAANMLVYGGGVAGLYGVGTLAEVRGKGIGAAISLQPLLDARQAGYHYGALYVTPMGYPVYKKLGFRDVNCQIGRYMWVNPG